MQGYREALKSRVSHMRSVMNKQPNYKGTVYRGSSIKNSFLEKLFLMDELNFKGLLRKLESTKWSE
ncbi:hypothetical protein AB6D56_24385 [Vibrio lentus]